MAEKPPPRNVLKLISDALARKKKHAPKPFFPDATLSNRIKLRRSTPPNGNGKGK